MKKKVIAIDFFCGCGGLTKGLMDAGIQVIKGIDLDSTVKESYEKNNPDTVFLNEDVRKLSPKKIIGDVDRKGKLLLLAGCAPCQPFTNFQQKIKYDRRKSLMLHFARFIDKIKPEFVLAENVPGFGRESNQYKKEFIKILEKNGYDFVEGVINAADYGVPQRRLRYVVMASRVGPISFPEPTHGNGRKRYVTVKDVIAKYPPIRAGQESALIPNHVSARLTKINLERIKSIPKNGGTRKNLPKNLSLKCHNNHNGHTDVYGRMRWNSVSPTLTCRCTSLSNGRFGHPTQNRALSVREAAALQTFPDNYVFYGDKTRVALHVGNAVPVLLAQKLGSSIVKRLKS